MTLPYTHLSLNKASDPACEQEEVWITFQGGTRQEGLRYNANALL